MGKTNKDKQAVISHKYADSPISHALHDLLNEIARLKEKYPTTDDNELVNLIETLAKKFHENILPQLDDRQIPGVASKASIAIDLFKYRNLNLDDYSITHPIAFELLDYIIKLSSQLPAKLEDLMPFLHPEAFVIDLHSGITGFAVEKITGKTYVTEHVKGDTQPSYAYKLTTHTKDKTVETTLDAAVIAPKQITDKSNYFLTKIQSWFIQNAETDHVKSEHARTSLLQRYTVTQTSLINSTIKKHVNDYKLEGDLTQTNPIALIHAIDEELNRNQSLLEENNRLQQELINKSTAYKTLPVSELLAEHPLLAKELQDNASQNLDVTYSCFPLPEQLIAIDSDTNRARLFDIKIALDNVIDNETGTLELYNRLIQNNLRRLTLQREMAIANWKLDVLDNAAQVSETLSATLETRQQELDKIDINSISVIYGNIQSIEEAILISEQQLQQRSKLQAKVPKLEAVKGLYQLSNDVAKLDNDRSLQKALTKIGKPVIETLQSLLNHIEAQDKEHQIRLYHLRSHLEKAQYETVFQEHMRSMDLDNISKLHTSATAQIKRIDETTLDLQEKIKVVEAEVVGKQSQLEMLLSQMKTQTALIEGFDRNNSELLGQVLTFCTQQQLYATSPEVNELIKDQATACDFLDGLMSSITLLHEQHVSDIHTPAYYLKASELLNKISECLNTAKDSIPFSQIEQLPCVKQWNPHTPVVFNDILTLLGQQSVISEWDKYRSRQDDFFSMLDRPKQNEFLDKFDFLSNQIKLKIKEFTSLLADKEKSEQDIKTLTTFRDTLPDIKDQIIQNCKGKANTTITDIDLQFGVLTSDITKCEQLAQQHRQSLEQFAINRKELNIGKQVLSNIIDILQGVDSCKQQIDLLAVNDTLTCTNNKLYKKFTSLQQTVKGFITKVQETALISSSLPQASTLQSSLDSLVNLLASTQRTITTTLRIKVNLNPLDLQIKSLENSYDSIQNEYSVLVNAPDFANNETAIADITSLVTRLRMMSESLIEQSAIIETVHQGLSTIEDEDYHSKIANIQSAKNTLNTNANKLGHLLIDTLLSRLNQWQTDMLVQSKRPGAESLTNLTNHMSKITSIRNQLHQLPGEEIQLLALAVDRCSPATTLAANKYLDILVAIKNTEAQLKLNETIDTNISQRIIERSELVDNLLLPKLDAYLMQRAYSGDYREQLVNTLKLQLQDYKNSGDSQTVIQTIKDNMANIPGIKLQTMFNKIRTELIDADRKIPVDYLNEQQLDPLAAHKQARAIGKRMQATHPEYVQILSYMYNQVLAMKQVIEDNDNAGQNFYQLADKLKNDLDRFVIAHPDGPPTKLAYTQFKDEFVTRLHSEDDVTGMHRAAWKPIVLNILIGLATLGIAIGVKLIHSKVSTGRCTFFFNETRRQEHIASLEELVTAPLAAGAA